MNDLPVEMLLVVGVTVLGAAGVLLAAWDPTSTANVPELATVLNWLRSNVKLAEALPALATCHTRPCQLIHDHVHVGVVARGTCLDECRARAGPAGDAPMQRAPLGGKRAGEVLVSEVGRKQLRQIAMCEPSQK